MGRNQLRSLSPPENRPKMTTSKCFCGLDQHEENCFSVTRSSVLFKPNYFAAVDPFNCDHWSHINCLLEYDMKKGCPHHGCGSKRLTGELELTDKVKRTLVLRAQRVRQKVLLFYYYYLYVFIAL